MSATAAILGGVSALGSLSNLISQASTNKTLQKMQAEQFEHDKQMWNLNNEYNSPIQQKNRLLDAGYNPLMMNGSVSTGNSNSPVKAPDVPNLTAPQVDTQGVVNSIMTSKQMEINKQQADTQEKRADTQNKVDVINATANVKNIEQAIRESLSRQNINEKQIENILADIRQKDEITKGLQISNQYLAQEKEANIKESLSRSYLNMLTGQKTVSETQFIDTQKAWYGKLSAAQIAKLQSGAYLDSASANRINELLAGDKRLQQLTAVEIASKVANIASDTKLKTVEQKQKAFDLWIQQNTGFKAQGGQLDAIFNVAAAALTTFTAE